MNFEQKRNNGNNNNQIIISIKIVFYVCTPQTESNEKMNKVKKRKKEEEIIPFLHRFPITLSLFRSLTVSKAYMQNKYTGGCVCGTGTCEQCAVHENVSVCVELESMGMNLNFDKHNFIFYKTNKKKKWKKNENIMEL